MQIQSTRISTAISRLLYKVGFRRLYIMIHKPNAQRTATMEQQQNEVERLFDDLQTSLPVAFARRDIPRLLPGVINPRSLANLESKGEGPEGFYTGRIRCYRREPFLSWLRSRVSTQRGLK